MLQTIEIILVLLLIAAQFIVFKGNWQLINKVKAMYPPVTQLRVETVRVDDPAALALSTTERILLGQVTFTWTQYPGLELAVAGEPRSGYLQLNQWYPNQRQWSEFMNVERQGLLAQLPDNIRVASELSDELEYDALMAQSPSPQFAQIVTDTNDYLQANKGAAADFNTLRDISEREANLLDEEIQAQLSTPLYLGLLGTFLGAILGLVALVNPFDGTQAASLGSAADSSFNNNDVTHFLGGVLIAMVGSLVGLFLTLVGNQLLKQARTTRDRLKNGYYNFLQKALLPRLNSDMQASMNNLKSVLDTFNQDFFSKIQADFFSKVAEFTPLIGHITENISIQKEFLEKLQKIGYTELANATIKVFDRVDQSAASFEKFLGYQKALNVSVEKGAQTVYTITALLDRLSGLEKALTQVPNYLKEHDDRIREQVQFFGQHQALLTKISQGVNQALNEDAAQMRRVLEKRLEEFEAQSQAAHVQWDAHFRQLNKDNVYKKIVEYLNPFQQLPTQQQELNRLQEAQARRNTEALQGLQQQLEQNRQIQEQLLQQGKDTKALLDRMNQRNWLQRLVN